MKSAMPWPLNSDGLRLRRLTITGLLESTAMPRCILTVYHWEHSYKEASMTRQAQTFTLAHRRSHLTRINGEEINWRI